MAKMGAPTKMTEEAMQKAQEYADSAGACAGDVVPSIVGLAVYLGVVTNTLHNWSKDNPYFLNILEKVKDKQHSALINKGLDGSYNSTITKLILTKHGYSDKVDSSLQALDKDGNKADLPQSDLAIIERFLNKKKEQEDDRS